MTRPTFSPARVLAVAVLAALSAWYIGRIASNAVPHGADRTRQEQPLEQIVRSNP